MADFREIVLASMAAVLVALVLSAPAAAQQEKGPQELLKSIGLTKPAFTLAPDFRLLNGNGGLNSLAQYRGSLVYSRQETHSEVIGTLAAGEEVVPLGKVSGAGEFW